jgi:hypothetical protein
MLERILGKFAHIFPELNQFFARHAAQPLSQFFQD